jgi:hypothetical protein
MPIHLNLLAEAQALEDQRRRDPVKRVIWVGAIAVALILAWSSSLMVKTIIAKTDINRLEGNLNSRTNEYGQILESQRNLNEDKAKLEALRRLAANRFLVGSLLNALQKTTVENVQLVRLKIDQTYTRTEEVKPKGADGRGGKPATATEKILLTLNAKDSSPTPGDAVNKLQQALSGSTYFQQVLGKSGGFRLTTLGTPQSGPDGKPFVFFTLEARLPDKTR